MAFTFFFRDRATLEAIEEHAVPQLKGRQYIRVWDAGCAMGPEPYSLAIILRENMGEFLFRNVRIHATDVDTCDQFGSVIAEGAYPFESVRRIPKPLFAKYFSPADDRPGHFALSAELRKAVQFQRHDLLSLCPVRSGFGIIVCKNVLLHFQEEERVEVIRMFHSALATNGFFATEQTQKLPREVERLFERVTADAQVFQKAG